LGDCCWRCCHGRHLLGRRPFWSSGRVDGAKPELEKKQGCILYLWFRISF
jgi:hypothetical protein